MHDETAQVVDAFATLNYSKRKHINSSCVEAFLNGKGLLVPVTTEAFVPRSSAKVTRQARGKSTATITRQLPETG